MHDQDRQVLLNIAEHPEKITDTSPQGPTSPTRMSRAAQAVIEHSEEFDLDAEAGAQPVETYISSLLADVLHLADRVRPGAAQDMLKEAILYTSETEVYDSLRGLKVGC